MFKDKKIWAWALYDWANSAFSTLILTFVFATYFTSSVMTDKIAATSLWSSAIGVSGLCLLVLSPITGAIADRTQRLKLWVFLLMGLMVAGMLLMDAPPASTNAVIYKSLCGLIVANIGFELGVVMVNAYLPYIATPENEGRVSSLGWGVGYMSGIASMVLTLFGFIGLGAIKPWFNVTHEELRHVRSVLPLASIWMILFSLPVFLFLPKTIASQVSKKFSLKQILIDPFIDALHGMKIDKNWRDFLIGSALYRDGLSTLFAVGGIYAAARFGMTTQQVLIFAIGINITAGIGCFISAYWEKRISPLRVVRLSLWGLMMCGACVLASPTATIFMVSAIILGFFVGPVQSASRTTVSKLSNPSEIGERFGIYALSGRAVSFVGPFLFAGLTQISNSQTVGLSSLLILWAIGYAFILNVKDEITHEN